MSSLIEILNQVQASETFQCSPINYAADLLNTFIQGGMTQSELRSQYRTQTSNAQFFFSHMPKEHIQENQRLFKKEFDFADELSAILITNPPVSDDSLMQMLQESLEKYLRSLCEAEA